MPVSSGRMRVRDSGGQGRARGGEDRVDRRAAEPGRIPPLRSSPISLSIETRSQTSSQTTHSAVIMAINPHALGLPPPLPSPLPPPLVSLSVLGRLIMPLFSRPRSVEFCASTSSVVRTRFVPAPPGEEAVAWVRAGSEERKADRSARCYRESEGLGVEAGPTAADQTPRGRRRSIASASCLCCSC